MSPTHDYNPSPAEQERVEERAAILEYEAGWPRVIAESEARRCVAHDRWKSQADPRSGWIQPPTWPVALTRPTTPIVPPDPPARAPQGTPP